MFQTAQLLAGCDPDVEGALFRQDPFIAVRSVEKVLAAKRITVISDPLSVRRSKLLQFTQQPDEQVIQYVARLRGVANVCQWTKSTQYANIVFSSSVQINYNEDMVKVVLMNGACVTTTSGEKSSGLQ